MVERGFTGMSRYLMTPKRASLCSADWTTPAARQAWRPLIQAPEGATGDAWDDSGGQMLPRSPLGGDGEWFCRGTH